MSGWLAPERLARLRQKLELSFMPIFLHRPLAILLLIPTADLPWVTPNRLTTVSVLLRFAVAALLWPEAWGGPADSAALIWTAVAFWHLGCVLDAADGTLARYRGESTLFGRYYDKISDRLVTLALPWFSDRDHDMKFRLWLDPHDEGGLEPGPYGMMQPLADAPEVLPNTVFVPVVGFTARRERLGQGGGHYDRWLALNPQVQTIGLAWDCQLVDSLPVEDHDIHLGAVVTPTRIYEGDN